MIIVRSPLRITLGGGGTDLPCYYRQRGGFLLSAAIDKYVYVTVLRPFLPGIYLKYSKLEHVQTVDQIEHPIIREVLRHLEFESPQIEITALADIPAGTGLGSSGSFSTALIKALYQHQRRLIMPHELAALACEIEIERLQKPVGKQDQYISAYGGLTCFEFRPDDSVSAFPLSLSADGLHELEDNLLLFFTGFERQAQNVLKDQDQRCRELDSEMMQNLDHIKALGLQSKQALESEQFTEFAAILNEHWQTKRQRSSGISNSKIDSWYQLGMENGALGGKLVGAGGGGFLMFYAEDRSRLRRVMRESGLEEVRFKFDFEGTKAL